MFNVMCLPDFQVEILNKGLEIGGWCLKEGWEAGDTEKKDCI